MSVSLLDEAPDLVEWFSCSNMSSPTAGELSHERMLSSCERSFFLFFLMHAVSERLQAAGLVHMLTETEPLSFFPSFPLDLVILSEPLRPAFAELLSSYYSPGWRLPTLTTLHRLLRREELKCLLLLTTQSCPNNELKKLSPLCFCAYSLTPYVFSPFIIRFYSSCVGSTSVGSGEDEINCCWIKGTRHKWIRFGTLNVIICFTSWVNPWFVCF